MILPSQAFWSTPADKLLGRLQTTTYGLNVEEARQRLARFGPNLLKPKRKLSAPAILVAQFKSPITMTLLLAAGLSFFTDNPKDALIILGIVFASGLLTYVQERRASNAVEKLLALVQLKTTAFRNGRPVQTPIEEVVPGDVILLSAGASIPADCRVLESTNLFVDEAALTGEPYPVEKRSGTLPPDTPLARRTVALFTGTHVVSGSAKAVAVYTGRETEFGRISERLQFEPPETGFERGVRQFGYFLLEVTLALIIAIFVINVYFARPLLEALLFSLAIAVGLTPQLLPAIVSVTLAHGAQKMARRKVIVKRLASIENFGGMNILCSDKTGTLTEGKVRVHAALDLEGEASDRVLLYAHLNARYQAGFKNPIDEAITRHRPRDVSDYRKLDEIPYDFARKRLSVLLARKGRHLLITKGALPSVLSACSFAETGEGIVIPMEGRRVQIARRFEQLSRKGLRVLGVAYRDVGKAKRSGSNQEMHMTFLGFLVLADPPKPGVSETLRHLKQLGVTLKLITGDNRWVAAAVSRQVGLPNPRILTGGDLRRMSDEALRARASAVDVFAEVEPNQKERIILALRKAGNVVGYVGDGINDAPALHAADVGISVEGAVDVAKEAADIVLLEKELHVLVQGVREGRITFANTLKYVFMATSANFGNMFSLAGASLFLPFLPLLPEQILLTNLFTDLPEMTIATDRVDSELVDRPRRWDLAFIRKFMITFGIVSSVFDYLTFATLLLFLNASTEQFRTGWFLESVVSAAIIVLVIRTRKPFYWSRPGRYLTAATLLVAVVTLALPYSPFGATFQLTPLPPVFILAMIFIVVSYVFAAETVKRLFYRNLAEGANRSGARRPHRIVQGALSYAGFR